MKVLIVYNTPPVPDERVKTLASWRKFADRVEVVFTFGQDYNRSFFDKVLYRAKLPNDPGRINRRVIARQCAVSFDIIFIVKGVYIWPWTLTKLKKMGAVCVFWSNDDMWGWHNRNIWFTLGARHYNLVVTQKSYNCNPDELPSIGARVLFQDKAYDPAVHDRIDDSSPGRCHGVVFVGTCEADRYRSLTYLAENGVAVDIYGWGSRPPQNVNPNLRFHNHHLYGREYAEVFSGSTICLNFLRRKSRDIQTGRSVEIPACGGFMLAERTIEHQRLFREGLEAEFFDTDVELLEKVSYYLKEPELCRRIAAAGYDKTRNAGYSLDSRIIEIVDFLK
jgi:spore maturation protein CgeB